MTVPDEEEHVVLTRFRGPDGHEMVRSDTARIVDGVGFGFSFGDGVCVRSSVMDARVLRAQRRAVYDAEQTVLGL